MKYLLVNLFVCRDEGHPELANLVVNERERRFVQTIVAFCSILIMRLPLASLRMILPLASLKFSIFLFKGCCCQGGEADRLTSVHWTLSSLPICELGDNNQLSWFNYQSFNLNNQIVHNNGLNCLTMTL